MSNREDNKRIAKNTVVLYLRTFITLIVGLYTSRIMLKALGVDNYGINNVVGSIVGMSSILTGAVSSSVVRFITYALGDNDKQRMRIVFSNSINVMIILSIIVAVVLEVFGVWFLNVKAEIPEGRMYAANWVLQFSIITLVLNILSSPYNATIIAHERMSIYAYMSIIQVVLNLSICYVIMLFHNDRLILFSFLSSVVALSFRIYYSWYCSRHFEESHYSWKLFDKSFIKEMWQFTGWYMIGNVVWVFNNQGINVLINLFFGVVMNAARGIALAVISAITRFVNNFTIAFVPQITKSYAAGDTQRLMFLIFQGTKIVWFLILLFSVPVFLEARTLLKLWLGNPPEYSTVFLRFALLESWSSVISFALHNTILASGKLKRVQLQIAAYTSLIFPITWISFKLGVPPWYSCLIFFIMNTTAKIFTLVELKRIINFPIRKFMKNCVARCTIVSVSTFIVPGMIVYSMPDSLTRFCLTVSVSIMWTIICSYFLGLNREERFSARSLFYKVVSKFNIVKYAK